MSEDQKIPETCDVVVIGSGATGMLAAVRMHDLGLKVAVVEKSDRYGGTAAVSGGGIWVPTHYALSEDLDDPERALTYLKAAIGPDADEARLRRFIADGARMAVYLNGQAGLPLAQIPGFPDYFSHLPGATTGRTLVPVDMDGKLLGDHFFQLRDCYSYLKLMGRLSLNQGEAGIIGVQARGWIGLLLRRLASYWLDIDWRCRTPRDRRLSNGLALVGGLRKAMLDRGIPLYLQTGLESLTQTDGRISGVTLARNGQHFDVAVRRGVLLACGGFESNQAMRKHYLAHAGGTGTSGAPQGINNGDGIRAGLDQGAAVANMELAWKAPVVRVPVTGEANVAFAQPLFWERGAAGSLCVNADARRFVDEAVSYDQFAAAMLADTKAGAHNNPCWIIFDADCRKRAMIGPLLPSTIMPDRKLPPEWRDTLYFKAASLQELARKIDLDPEALHQTVSKFNEGAAKGEDPEFGRGSLPYDQFFADPRVKPNGCLAPLAKGPFYAMRLEAGDIGTKGGLVTDDKSRVLDTTGKSITGLYAAGNTAASIFNNAYPGAGGTLGPALTAAFIAAEQIASDTAG